MEKEKEMTDSFEEGMAKLSRIIDNMEEGWVISSDEICRMLMEIKKLLEK
jgi:hypothetical protein